MKIFFQKNIGAVLCVSMSLAILINIQSVNAQTTSTSWLSMQINKHPDIIAAKEEMNAVFSNAEGNKQPLYNPELETGYEREGDANNYSIGINQTID